MSRCGVVSDLVELLKPVYGERGFGSSVPALLAVSDPDLVLHPAGIWLDSDSVVCGHGAVRAFFEDLEDALGALHFEPERFEQRGDQVAIEVRMEMRGRHTGITETRRLSHLWRFRDGKAVELRAFAEPDGAFAALGRA
ncbi:MAG: SnoaL-like polyketide cyclase [Thermoleophilaceae bacterium]|jgi:ketosteroid isomerase-like protein|nr:SnoaL-like polyketide cyclase [Thermoleophilaceae bacterium]